MPALTGRERVRTILRGEVPDRAAFALNIGQWFGAHKARGDLPAELAGCANEVEAMKKLGCDIFSRRCGHFVRETRGPHIRVRHEPDRAGGQAVPQDAPITTYFETPHGTLSSVEQFQPESHTTFVRQYPWRDFESEYAAVRYLIEQTEYHFDAAAFARARAQVGDDGVVIVGAQQAPIKRIFNLAGAENGILWILDREEEMRELMALHTEKAVAFAREVAESEAEAMMSMDNLDSLFYTPEFFDRYCKDYYRRIGEILHARGKFWTSHACGRVAVLKEQVAAVELDGLEGTPHAPLGDMDLAAFRDSIPYRKHVVWGGMTCHEQEVRAQARERIRDHVRRLFATLRPFHRFFFSSACNTSIATPFQNILYFRDFCWEFGRN